MGKAQVAFEDALGCFLHTASTETFLLQNLPTWKTVSDRFKRIVAVRKEQVKFNTTTSRNMEIQREKDMLLDDLILEMKEREELETAEKEGKEEKENRLLEAGENIREMALRRRICSSPPDPAILSPPTDGDPSTPVTTLCRCIHYDTDDEKTAKMLQQMILRAHNDDAHLIPEQQRLAMDHDRSAADAKRTESSSLLLSLDEKKAKIELSECQKINFSTLCPSKKARIKF